MEIDPREASEFEDEEMIEKKNLLVDKRLFLRLEIGLRLRRTLLTSFIRDNRDLSDKSKSSVFYSKHLFFPTEFHHFALDIRSRSDHNRTFRCFPVERFEYGRDFVSILERSYWFH